MIFLYIQLIHEPSRFGFIVSVFLSPLAIPQSSGSSDYMVIEQVFFLFASNQAGLYLLSVNI